MEDKRNSSSGIASSTRTQMSKSQLPKVTKNPSKTPNTFVILVIVLIIALVSSVYFFKKYQDSQNQLKNPNIAAQAQTRDVVEQVAKHTDLPAGQPTVATVSDVSKLSNQTFFANAKNGDKVLIYSDAKKAILYRPSEQKVINIATLNIGDKQTTPSTTGTTSN